jgi:hypothetical protein
MVLDVEQGILKTIMSIYSFPLVKFMIIISNAGVLR